MLSFWQADGLETAFEEITMPLASPGCALPPTRLGCLLVRKGFRDSYVITARVPLNAAVSQWRGLTTCASDAKALRSSQRALDRCMRWLGVVA